MGKLELQATQLTIGETRHDIEFVPDYFCASGGEFFMFLGESTEKSRFVYLNTKGEIVVDELGQYFELAPVLRSVSEWGYEEVKE